MLKPITCTPLWLKMPILQKKAAIEDWTKYPRVEMAFRNILMTSVFYRFQHIGMCRNQTFSFLCYLRFPFYEDAPIDDWHQVPHPHLEIALRGYFLIGPVFYRYFYFYRSLHLRMCRNQNFHFFITYGFCFMEKVPVENWGQVSHLEIAIMGNFFI